MEKIRRARVKYKSCPLCKSKQIADFLKADCTSHVLYNPVLPKTMAWKRCTKCEHVFTDGYFTLKSLDVIFSKTPDYQTVGCDIESERDISAEIVQRIDTLRDGAQGRWLDVGFGNGSLLFTADEWGYEVIGVDLRQTSVDAINALGIEAYCVELTKFSPPEPLDVVSMADVLEHMPFPDKALQHVYKLLEVGGVLFISMPNMVSQLWRTMDQQNINPYWGEIEHYHNFGRGRLFSLLEDCGFQDCRYGVSKRYRACMEITALRRR